MSPRKKTPEEIHYIAVGSFLFWVLAKIWPFLLVLAVGIVWLILGAFAIVWLPISGLAHGDTDAFVLGLVILAVFSLVGVWFFVSWRRERREAEPPPKLPAEEERKKAEALWKF